MIFRLFSLDEEIRKITMRHLGELEKKHLNLENHFKMIPSKKENSISIFFWDFSEFQKKIGISRDFSRFFWIFQDFSGVFEERGDMKNPEEISEGGGVKSEFSNLENSLKSNCNPLYDIL